MGCERCLKPRGLVESPPFSSHPTQPGDCPASVLAGDWHLESGSEAPGHRVCAWKVPAMTRFPKEMEGLASGETSLPKGRVPKTAIWGSCNRGSVQEIQYPNCRSSRKRLEQVKGKKLSKKYPNSYPISIGPENSRLKELLKS